jgi:hypothetical protein
MIQIIVSKDISTAPQRHTMQITRWHVTLMTAGRLFYSARTHPTAMIDVAVAATADELREKGCDVRVW